MNSIDSAKGKRIIVAITGASGAIYARRLLEMLAQMGPQIDLIASAQGLALLRHELGEPHAGRPQDDPRSWLDLPEDALERIRLHSPEDLAAAPASGSCRVDGMIVVPCSMKTLASIANGHAENLIARSADVQLKERRPLVVVAREMPLSAIHLENMLKLTRAGGIVLPACPPFYHKPQTITDLVDAVAHRALSLVGLPHPQAFEYNP